MKPNEAMSGCLLSIIVPVYNVGEYIEMCLDSLLEQDIEKSWYEIICVNDGSTDNSLSILQEYAKTNGNIRVINKTNGGVASARNLGLDSAIGQYIWFVDADDWLARNSFALIAEQIQKYHPSAIQLSFDYIRAEWRITECQKAVLQSNNVTCQPHGIEVMEYVNTSSTIIRHDILIRYGHRFIENLHYGEDILFIRELFDRMRIETESKEAEHTIVHCCGDIFYYYRQHEILPCIRAGRKTGKNTWLPCCRWRVSISNACRIRANQPGIPSSIRIYSTNECIRI